MQGGQVYSNGGEAVMGPTRSIRNPNNLNPQSLHSKPSLQGFREDYHAHAPQGDDHDVMDDEMDVEGSDDEVAQALQGHGQHVYHYSTAAQGGEGDERMLHKNGHLHGGEEDMDEEDEEEEEEEEEDAAGEFSDSLSSSPSIPDDDIDFNLVYALHTFLATVDGQASVVKGDKLLLLDDSNSYWWLVRVLKTQAIGYIPAENIETPWERLARLNKHRNVDLTTATQHDVLTGPTSSSAQTRFAGRIPPSEQPHPHESRHPYSKGIPASPSHKDHPRNISPPPHLQAQTVDEYGVPDEAVLVAGGRPPSSKAKTVLFTAPTYYAHSATGLTSEEEEEGEEGEEGYYDEEGGEEGEGDGVEREYADQDDGRPGFRDVEDGQVESEQSRQHHHQQHLRGEAESGFSEEDDHMYGRGEGALEGDEADVEDADLDGEANGGERDDSATLVHSHQEHVAAGLTLAAASSPPRDIPAALVPGGGLARPAATPSSVAAEAPRRPLSPANRQLSSSSATPAAGPALQQTKPAAGLGIGFGATEPLSVDGESVSNKPLTSSTRSREFDENELLDPQAPTKKLSATPAIARTGSGGGAGEVNRGPVSSSQASQLAATAAQSAADRPKRTVRGVEIVDPRDPRYNRMLQPTKQAGEDLMYERVVADAQRQQQRQYDEEQQIRMQHQRQEQLQAAAAAQRSNFETPDLHDEDIPGGEGLGDSTNSRRTSTGSADTAGGGSGSEKKRKSGGGILGLFRKKDKKKKNAAAAAEGKDDATAGERRTSEEDSLRSSTSSAGMALRRSGSGSPSGFRSSLDRSIASHNARSGTAASGSHSTAESMFSTDAALRQQEVEAKQALYQQYGVSRAPGDVSNTMTPRGMPGGLVMSSGPQRDASPSAQQAYLGASGSTNSNSNRNSLSLLSHPASILGSSTGGAGLGSSALNSPTTLAPPGRTRPGSLLGSPNVSGVEVPLLSVMRVFAGENVDSDATFKTVLINQSTSSSELVKQAMQRFRLTSPALRPDDFYLTVKELGGDERQLGDSERPLEIFEELSERTGDDGLALPPNVRRSSIGSINSISSNLTLNSAITRSGVGDWSDDSAVKFYLHRRVDGHASFDLDRSAGSEAQMAAIAGLRGEGEAGSSDSHPTISQLGTSITAGPSYRFAVRLILHPSDLPDNVAFDPHSEAVIPKALLAERQQRSGASSLASSTGQRQRILFFPRNANVSEVVETALDRFGIGDGVVDGGDEVEDRVSRRRSATRVKYSLAVERDGQEAFLPSSGKLLDAYSTPPAFKAYDRSSKEFRRRSADAALLVGTSSDVQPTDPVFVIRRSPNRSSITRGVLPQSVDELDQLQQRRRTSAEAVSPRTSESSGARPTQRELIAAQRAASQANQRALLSASRAEDNTDHSQTTLRADEPSVDEIRYSLMGEDSTETDLRQDPLVGLGLRPTDHLSRGVSTATTQSEAESFRTAKTSFTPTPLATPGVEDLEEDERAIAALRNADVGITPDASNRPTRTPSRTDEASGARARSPIGADETLQERLDRVLARVREDKARRAASPTEPPRPRSYIDSSGEGTGSGRFSPVNVAARSASALGGRRSPFGDKLSDSPSIEQIISSPRSAVHAGAGQHGKKPSLASFSSANSNTTGTGTDQLSTPVTPSNAHSLGYTPASSATSNHRVPVVYPADYGFDFLAAVVAAEAQPRTTRRPEPTATERVLGSPRDLLSDVHPDVRAAYEEPSRTLSALEARLDQLLMRAVNV
ncbi:hypothetical protein JCM10908_005471 [Rhodotorula pacifica]|uniref:protein phosphatase regulator BUD14 n=1 Tax=Rhodotorula pacifica TaxID=1495444 RepID=UPI0031738A78